jgi:hypothetical protein
MERHVKPAVHRTALIAFLGLVLSGCANHIRLEESDSEIPRNELVKQSFSIDGAGDLIESPQVNLHFSTVAVYNSKIEFVTIRTEEFTPYSGWREFYEVPAGLITAGPAIVFKLLDILTLDFIPNDASNGFANWSFAALNPFLNAQSEKRSTTLVTEEITGETEATVETLREPLANLPVHVRINGTPAEELRTNDEADLSFHLLEILPGRIEKAPRKLIVSGPPGSTAAEMREEIFIGRELGQNLVTASNYLVRYDATRYSLEFLANSIYTLDQLGFKAFSLRLEDQAIAQRGYDEEAIAELKRQLEMLYSGNVPPEE